MFFRNFDNYYQDFDYDSDPSPSPPFRRSGSPLRSRTSRCRSSSSPSSRTHSITSARPVIGDDGWEVLPAELLDPSNWGLPLSSHSNTPSGGVEEASQDNTPRMYPGGSSSKFRSRNGGVMQFYPDHDPDLINTNQLDGMPYVLQNSTIPSEVKIGSALVPKVVVNATYNASSAGQKKLSFSQRWEQGLLEMAHSNPETLRNYSRNLSRDRGFSSFAALRWDEDREQERMASSGDTVSSPDFGGLSGEKRVRSSTSAFTPPATTVYRREGAGQILSNGRRGGTPGYALGGRGHAITPSAGSGDRERPGGYGCGRDKSLAITHQPPPTLGGGYGSAASYKTAGREPALGRDTASKVKQVLSNSELKRKAYMKEITVKKKAADKRSMLEERAVEVQSVSPENLEHDGEARDRIVMNCVDKFKDVRHLAAEAERDGSNKDLQHERAESSKENGTGEEREKKEFGRARPKQYEEQRGKYLIALKKRGHDVEPRNSKARKVNEKIKDAGQLAREASERRFAAMKRDKLPEERNKPFQKPAARTAQGGTEPSSLRSYRNILSLVCKDCGKRFGSKAQVSAHVDKSGHQNFVESTTGPVTGKPIAKLDATPALKPAPATAPEKRSLPTRPVPKSAPQPRAPPCVTSSPQSPTKITEEKLTPRERVRLATAMREAAIRALPAEESSDFELDGSPPLMPKPAAAPAKPIPRTSPKAVAIREEADATVETK